MKTLTFFVIFFAGLSFFFLPSCQQEETIEPEIEKAESFNFKELPYHDEITITDSLQKNTIVLRFSSKNPLPADIEFASSLKIEPVFETPEMPERKPLSSTESRVDTPDLENQIWIEIVSEDLEDGAKGVRIINNPVPSHTPSIIDQLVDDRRSFHLLLFLTKHEPCNSARKNCILSTNS